MGKRVASIRMLTTIGTSSSSYNQAGSSQQTYGGSSIARLVQASQAGSVNEYGDQQATLYEGSPNNSTSYVYETNNAMRDDYSSDGAILTEDDLLRSHANNGGKFPTHLLTKLGSQKYDLPDQVDSSNSNRRTTTTTTTTRYYTVNQGEAGYDSAIDEADANSIRNGEEKYVQIKASDLKSVLANYEDYSNAEEKRDEE